MSNWVKMSEVKPKVGTDVILYSEDDGLYEMAIVRSKNFMGDTDSALFVHVDDHDRWVTWYSHWQPLPAPPEDE